VRYIWTSGRKCNFNGCDRPDLQPQNINGWFWSGSGAKIGPTTQRNSGDWSNTGGYGQPQPDNREAAQVEFTCQKTLLRITWIVTCDSVATDSCERTLSLKQIFYIRETAFK